MPFQLEKVIPWGRSFDEYIAMFDLTPADLQLKIIDCAGGPASFNSEMNRLGYSIISCDPIYQFTAAEINQRIEETYNIVVDRLKANKEDYIWQKNESPEHLGEVRMAAMEKFLADFPLGVKQGRYLTAELPKLPFNTGEFDLALCSHLLFSYSDHLTLEFHRESILELCRIAKEVRIFPLLKLSGETSPWLLPAIEECQSRGYEVETKRVGYQFQKGGDRMLRILRDRKLSIAFDATNS
ncbi:MAG: SAM-dependent methyltransferase [Okeania sp. SIO2H7]|nr:SAM-dependent methyltransferase [Okeania sp. SIO2H7]